jgi:integrase
MKQKKFKGIYEYYRVSDPDKATVSYYITVRDNEGKARKVKTEATNPEEAVTALAHYKALRTSKQLDTPEHKLTLNNLANRFFSQRTRKNNNNDKRRFELHVNSVIGNKCINKLSKKDILHLQSHLQQKLVPANWRATEATIHLSPKTINIITDIVYRLLNWACDQELLRNPLPKIVKLHVDNERQRVFSQNELDTIFDSVDAGTYIFLMLAYHTAQRPQSIVNLQKKHIINGSILIESIKHQTSHLVPISSKLGDALLPWVEYLEPNDYIVTKGSNPVSLKTIQGRVLSLFSELFNKGLDYRKDSKQWASLYTLRHTALTNIYANTSDIYAAQSIANHSSIKMTQRYAKHSEKLKRNAVEGL